MLLYVDPADAFDYSYPILLASVVSLLYSSMIYYFNKATDDERGKLLYKNEIKAIVMNGIIFLMVILGWKAINELAHTTGGNYLVELAQNKVENSLIVPFPEEAHKLIIKYLPSIGFLSSMSGSGSFSVHLFETGFKIGGSYQSSAYNILLDKMNNFYYNAFNHIVYLSGLRYLMEVFEFFAIKFFLPLGIFLRTFSYTRKLGSTMVSVAIGAGLVLPIAVYLTSDVAHDLMDDSSFLGVTGLLNDASANAYELDFLVSSAKLDYIVLQVVSTISKITSLVSLALNITALAHIPIVSQVASILFSAILIAVKAWTFEYYVAEMLSLTDGATINYVFSSLYLQYMAQALIGITIGLSIFYFIVALSVIGFIRAFSMILGGEFFLYGVEGMI